MNLPWKKMEKDELDDEMKACLFEMGSIVDKTDDEYEAWMKRLSQLIDLKKKRMETSLKKEGLDAKTIATMVTTFGSILLIMAFEERHIITTKAFNFIPRGRV